MESTLESYEKTQNRRRLIAACLSVFVGAALMGLKFYVYRLTGSTAILSDALESIINVVAGSFALGSIVLASKPPDPTHPYGHGKIEYFSAGFEGALIIFAAIGIVRTAIPQILEPRALPNLEGGVLILLVTSLVNFILGIGLIRVGKRTRSLTLTADGKHILTDVYTSAGVVLGLVLVHFTGWFRLDGIIACLVALNILIMGFRLVRESFAGLMDESDPLLLEEITGLITRNRKETWIDIHKLRAWRSGNRVHVDFHLILPRDLSLEETHNEVMQLQEKLKSSLPGLGDALIHAEPCIDPECPVCAYDPCDNRREPVKQLPLWRREELTNGKRAVLSPVESDGEAEALKEE